MEGYAVRSAWYHESFPDHVIVQIADASWRTFRAAPFRNVTEDECEVYWGHHPRHGGIPVPAYIWRFYGLVKAPVGA